MFSFVGVCLHLYLPLLTFSFAQLEVMASFPFIDIMCSLGNAGSRDCSRTSMWFTAGDGWDPADFWADCFEKTLWFLF